MLNKQLKHKRRKIKGYYNNKKYLTINNKKILLIKFLELRILEEHNKNKN
jgi:hypothetical protein